LEKGPMVRRVTSGPGGKLDVCGRQDQQRRGGWVVACGGIAGDRAAMRGAAGRDKTDGCLKVVLRLWLTALADGPG